MRTTSFILLTLSLIAAILFASNSVLATQHVGYACRLVVYDNATGRDTVYFGVTNDSNSSYCIDNTDTLTLPQYGVVVHEFEVPPYPVDGIFDLRFLDSRSGNGVCLGNGEKYNFHAGSFVPASDTFKLHFLGSLPAGGAYPFHLEWTLPDTSTYLHYTKFVMKYISPDPDTGGTKTVNMTTTNSIEFDDNNIISATFICTSSITGVKQTSNVVPERFVLNQNYPNPFNPTTTINYDLPKTAHVQLLVYNILGQEVLRVVDQQQTPGQYQATIDASLLSSGVYFYRLTAGPVTSVKRMIVMK